MVKDIKESLEKTGDKIADIAKGVVENTKKLTEMFSISTSTDEAKKFVERAPESVLAETKKAGTELTSKVQNDAVPNRRNDFQQNTGKSLPPQEGPAQTQTASIKPKGPGQR